MKLNISFHLMLFSVLYWADYFISLGRVEMNPLYSSTNKLIFFPIVIVSVLLINRFYSTKMKFPLIFLISLFAFAFVWNIAGVYGATLIDRDDSYHHVASSTSNFIAVQRLPTSVYGSIVTGFAWTLTCTQPTSPITANAIVARVDTNGNISSVLGNGTGLISDTGASTNNFVTFNFSLVENATLAPTTTDSYALLINTSTSCNSTLSQVFAVRRANSGTDTANENFYITPNAFKTDNYIGTPLYSSTALGTSSYKLFGTLADFSNQTSTSSCNSLNGQECSSQTTQLTFPVDCSPNSMQATLTHSINLFNGSAGQVQYATAITQFIKPANNQFSNVTNYNWSSQVSKSFDLIFTKSNYNAGDVVQAQCNLNTNLNVTSGISSCSLVAQCVRSLAINTTYNNSVVNNLFTPTTSTGALQLLDIFLSPFMIMTLLAFGIAGFVTVALRNAMKEHGGIVFVSMLLVLFFSYTVIGIYPIYIGIVFIIIMGLILTKMIMGFFK